MHREACYWARSEQQQIIIHSEEMKEVICVKEHYTLYCYLYKPCFGLYKIENTLNRRNLYICLNSATT